MEGYTAHDKLKEVERELFWRHRVYPKMIATNALTQKAAKRQIGIMEAIAEDYRRQAGGEELPLNQEKEAIP